MLNADSSNSSSKDDFLSLPVLDEMISTQETNV